MDLGGVREDVVLGDVHRLRRVLCAPLVDHGCAHGLISGRKQPLGTVDNNSRSLRLPKRTGILLVVIRHLLLWRKRERLCTEVEHRVDFVAQPMVLETVTMMAISC